MPKGTTLEKLTFADVLDASDLIIAHADALKVSYVSFMFPGDPPQGQPTTGKLVYYCAL